MFDRVSLTVVLLSYLHGMTSRALITWRSERAARLDRLEVAHAAVGGTGPGRRWLTEELNHALILRLAAEFQGFAGDLHTETAAAVAVQLAPNNIAQRATMTLPYQLNRRLDRGNADPNSLRDDFGMFGLRLWDELQSRYPVRGQRWPTALSLLNQARNGLAHADDQKVARVEAAGWHLTLRSVRRWRGTLDALASAMDTALCDYLARLFSTRPW
jgi:hypothetical protein